jgi:hypothetical protein
MSRNIAESARNGEFTLPIFYQSLVNASTLIPIAGAGASLAVVGVYLAARVKKNKAFQPLPRDATETAGLSMPDESVARRKFVRRSGNRASVLIAEAEEPEAVFPGWVVDRSSGGLGMQAPRPAAVDALLLVRAVHAPEGAPWTEVRVRSSVQLGKGHWALGCEFVETPPWNVLLLFG